MSIAWVLLIAVTGAGPSNSGYRSDSRSEKTKAVTVTPADRSGKELPQAVAEALRRANAKSPDYVATVTGLVELFKELGKDRQLAAEERQRLGVEVRSRLLRF